MHTADGYLPSFSGAAFDRNPTVEVDEDFARANPVSRDFLGGVLSNRVRTPREMDQELVRHSLYCAYDNDVLDAIFDDLQPGIRERE